MKCGRETEVSERMGHLSTEVGKGGEQVFFFFFGGGNQVFSFEMSSFGKDIK